jgi:hypothetical protein
MNNFPPGRTYSPEQVVDDRIDMLSARVRLLYGDWILDLKKGKTFIGLNWNWPNLWWSGPKEFYDTYVFSWHGENWPNIWLKNFCESHPDSLVIVIGESPIPEKYYDLPNLKSLVYHSWGQMIQDVLQFNHPEYVPMSKRQHLLSSLVNKPSFFKALTTAQLLSKYNHKDIIYSWNVNKRKEYCSSLNFLESQHMPNSKLENLSKFYHEQLKHQTYKLDDFNDTGFSNFYCDIPAYTDCLINVTNETYDQTLVDDVILPSPYISEKTWKPLLSGCSLLSQGSRGVYDFLKNFGFQFEYPWDTSYDQTLGDIDRYMSFLTVLDSIFEMDRGFLMTTLEESAKFNYHHIRSEEFFSRVKKINNESLENFMRYY